MTSSHGKQSEELLAIICARMFGPDYVLKSPVVIEPSGKKEVADILLVIDDTLVVVQSKALQLDAADLDDVSFGRIKKRHDAAKQQLNTLLNARDRKAEVVGTTIVGVELRLDWKSISHIIGMVTMNLPDGAYEDPEFRFQYPELCSVQRGMEVHTFLLRDLWQIAGDITSPGDALLYLSGRKTFLDTQGVILGNELDLLALYRMDYPQLVRAKEDPSFKIFIGPGLWEGYQRDHQDALQDRDERHKIGFILDNFVRALRRAVEASCDMHGISNEESVQNYLKAIGKLGKLTRAERAWIGEKILEKLEKTKISEFGFFAYSSSSSSDCFVFLLLNNNDRKERLAFLEEVAIQACHKLPGNYTVGLGLPGERCEANSIDMIILDAQYIRDNIEVGRSLFGDFQHQTLTEWSHPKA